MNITIWSDFVCPFCYIAEAHLAQAMKDFAHKDEIEIEYNSFQLDPYGQHIEGLTYAETFSKLKGIKSEETEKMFQQINAMANNTDLEINYDKAVYANTLDAHRLFQYAKEVGLGNEFFHRFYQAHFVEGINLENHSDLLNLSLEVGLDKDQVETILANKEANQDKVMQEIGQAQAIGVQGVPFFVFDGKYGVSGAQAVETFAQVLEKVWDEK